jgi:hypothetical protein
MPRSGRPTKLNPERQAEIVSAIKAGNYAEIAAAYAGISRGTYFLWMKKGKEDARSGKETIYSDFFDAVKKAESDAEVRAVAIIQRAMPENWQAAMTYLERKFPARWSRGERLEHGGEGLLLKIGDQWIGKKDDRE